MNQFSTILATLLMTLSVFLPQISNAQAPEKMSYQAVIRNSSNKLVTNQQVGMRISILQGSASGNVVYQETQTPTTNTNGLASLEIGTGNVVKGDFSSINWTNGPYFIKTETDPAGGTNYNITGTTQLLSVPYALHAKTADSIVSQSAVNNNRGKTYLILQGDITNAEAQQRIQKNVGPNTQFIYIRNTTQLTSVSIPGVEELMELRIKKNNALNSISFPDLTKIIGGTQSNPGFSIKNNAQLASYNFNNLTSIPSGEISNTGFNNLNLNNLNSVNSFKVKANSSITSISLENIPNVKQIKILNNEDLTSISLKNLTNGKVEIENNNSLTSIDLTNLSKSSYISISSNKSLSNLSLPSLIDLNNKNRTRILFITNNSSLKSIGLDNLNNGGIVITYNKNLKSIDLPKLSKSGIIFVFNNKSLSSLSFPNLDYSSVGGFDTSENSFPSSKINTYLAKFVAANVTGVNIDLSGQTPPAPPTGQGVNDKQTLINNGNTVTTD